jgi:hypothetical protein
MSDRAFKLDALALDLEEHAAFLLVHGGAQLVFQLGHAMQDIGDEVVHGASIRPAKPAV